MTTKLEYHDRDSMRDFAVELETVFGESAKTQALTAELSKLLAEEANLQNNRRELQEAIQRSNSQIVSRERELQEQSGDFEAFEKARASCKTLREAKRIIEQCDFKLSKIRIAVEKFSPKISETREKLAAAIAEAEAANVGEFLDATRERFETAAQLVEQQAVVAGELQALLQHAQNVVGYDATILRYPLRVLDNRDLHQLYRLAKEIREWASNPNFTAVNVLAKRDAVLAQRNEDRARQIAQETDPANARNREKQRV